MLRAPGSGKNIVTVREEEVDNKSTVNRVPSLAKRQTLRVAIRR